MVGRSLRRRPNLRGALTWGKCLALDEITRSKEEWAKQQLCPASFWQGGRCVAALESPTCWFRLETPSSIQVLSFVREILQSAARRFRVEEAIADRRLRCDAPMPHAV